ncbi:hypothetical protein U1Q18_030253 [Sarracenia purpurea var. burkii]
MAPTVKKLLRFGVREEIGDERPRRAIQGSRDLETDARGSATQRTSTFEETFRMNELSIHTARTLRTQRRPRLMTSYTAVANPPPYEGGVFATDYEEFTVDYVSHSMSSHDTLEVGSDPSL